MILNIICIILVGALVGWLAGKVMKKKHKFWGNALIGIGGSLLGGAIAKLLGVNGGLVVELLFDVAGACILMYVIRKLA